MKRWGLVLLASGMAILAGCVVTSVCPFYTEEDLVSEPAILGSWINLSASSNEVWRFEASGELAYRFTLIEPRKATVMEARAFKIQGQLFLDIFSLEKDFHVVPAHYLLKVTRLTPTLEMAELDEEWIKGLLTKDGTILRHHFVRTGDKPEDSRVVLTADTPELKKFISDNLNTQGAWRASFDLHRDPASVKNIQEKGLL